MKPLRPHWSFAFDRSIGRVMPASAMAFACDMPTTAHPP